MLLFQASRAQEPFIIPAESRVRFIIIEFLFRNPATTLIYNKCYQKPLIIIIKVTSYVSQMTTVYRDDDSRKWLIERHTRSNLIPISYHMFKCLFILEQY